MSNLDIDKMLIVDEGLKLKIYKDSKGIETFGVGRKASNGFRLNEVRYMLQNDIDDFRSQLVRTAGVYNRLSPLRQSVFLNIAFNCGVDGLLGFTEMILACEKNDWIRAGLEILNSEIERNRANRLKQIMQTEVIPNEYY
jgi:lysozyme